MPLVSIIIPTYNYAHFITAALQSIEEQDFPKELTEVIVYDDGSKDNTKEVVAGFKGLINIRYFWQENKGKADATSKAIQKASGKYIFNLDADDYFLPGKIKRTVEIFESDESIVHVASQAKQVHEHLEKITFENFRNSISDKKIEGYKLLDYFFKNNILLGGGSTYAARASVLKSINIPPAVDMYIDEFLVYAVLPYGKSFLIKDYLSVWRGHGKNYSAEENTGEVNLVKEQRLASSSEAVLGYLELNNFNKEIIKLYKVKHLTRLITFKEVNGHKTFADILSYFFKTISAIAPHFTKLKRYNFYNRLIPTSLLIFFKKLLQSN